MKLTKTNSFPVRRSEPFDWKCVTFEFSAFVIYKSRIWTLWLSIYIFENSGVCQTVINTYKYNVVLRITVSNTSFSICNTWETFSGKALFKVSLIRRWLYAVAFSDLTILTMLIAGTQGPYREISQRLILSLFWLSLKPALFERD